MLDVKGLREDDATDNAEWERRRASGIPSPFAEQFRDFYGGMIAVYAYDRRHDDGQVSMTMTFGAGEADPTDPDQVARVLKCKTLFLPATVAKSLGERLVKEADLAIAAAPDKAGKFVDDD